MQNQQAKRKHQFFLRMKLFVARLPQSATSDSLKKLFESYGVVTEAKVIMDKETGMSKGYGFVEMTTSADAQKAINALNESNLDGKDILVKPSDPAPKRTDEKRSFNKPDGDRRENRGRDDRKKYPNPFEDRDRHDNGWETKKNLRPRRKRI